MPEQTREQLKAAALTIFRAGLAAVDPQAAVARCLTLANETLSVARPGGAPLRFDLRDYQRIVVVGGGKATALMSQAAEELLEDRITEGLIVVKYGHAAASRRVNVMEAGHPVPDEAGRDGAEAMVSLLESLGEEDLVLSLISGGGSALLPLPCAGITLAEKQELTTLLLRAGAAIGEINTVRKHVSGIKGGGLARAAYPATVINLMLSDVVGDHLDVIASGPTVPDASTFDEAQGILRAHGLWDRVAGSIRDHLVAGAQGSVKETPKEGDPLFDRCTNLVIGSNIMALRACAEAARAAGYSPLVLSSTIEGETREIARMHGALGREIVSTGLPVKAPACMISGGETTVTLGAEGKGGRNQEFAVAAALEIAGLEGVAVMCCGTDGTDGPTDAAGAIAFGDTVARGRTAGLSARRALEEHDAYPFFEGVGDLIKTGPTGTNVMDVRLVLVSG